MNIAHAGILFVLDELYSYTTLPKVLQTITQITLKSSGTLLPLPALYFLSLGWKFRGLGKSCSSGHFHRGSSTTIRWPLVAPRPFTLPTSESLRVGLGLLAPPLGIKVNALGSSMDRPTDPECARAGGPFDGGGGGGAGDRGEGALGGGGGGGAEMGEVVPAVAARIAACAAIVEEMPLCAETCGGGGGGGCDREGAAGGRGAEDGGGGGGAGGNDGAADDGGGGAGAEGGAADESRLLDGLRDPGGGGGFLPIGGGGPLVDAEEFGRDRSVLFRLAIDRFVGKPGTARPGTAGAAPMGGLGAEATGGRGADDREDSGSDR